MPLSDSLTSDSYLEHAFLRWILQPAAHLTIAPHVFPQKEVARPKGKPYRIGYAIEGATSKIAVELDGSRHR